MSDADNPAAKGDLQIARGGLAAWAKAAEGGRPPFLDIARRHDCLRHVADA